MAAKKKAKKKPAVEDDYLAQYDRMGPDWISSSALVLLMTCGIAFRKRYIERIPEPRNIRAVIGTGAHKGREVNLKQKVESQTDLAQDQTMDAARDSVNDAFDVAEIMMDDDFAGKPREVARGQAVDISVSCAELDYRTFQVGIMPKEVEVVKRVEFPQLGMDLVGKLDVVDLDDWIHDLKTGKRAKNERFVQTDPGLTTYGVLKYCTDGSLPNGYTVENVVAGSKGVRALTFTATRTEEQLNRMLARYHAAMLLIKAGRFIPCSPGFWKCDPRYCGYHPTCEFASEVTA